MDSIMNQERMEKKAALDEIRARLEAIRPDDYPFGAQADKAWSDLRAKADQARAALARAEEALAARQDRVKQLQSEIDQKESELSGLGLFKGAAKRALREQIAALKEAVPAARSEAKEQERAFGLLNYEYKDAQGKVDAFLANAVRAEKTRLQCQACALILGADSVADDGTIRFGRCASGDGTQPIEWRVIDVGSSSVLLITEYGIDCKPFHERLHADLRAVEDVYEPGTYYYKPIPVTWETCSLRQWLNGAFLRAAFSEAERSLIRTEKVKADKNPYSEVNAGNATKDRVFLLSVPEAERYLPSNEERRCRATPYAKAHGAYEDPLTKYTDWWLRSPGREETQAAYVDSNGAVYYYGTVVTAAFDTNGMLKNPCVRPVIRVGLA